MRVWTVLVVSLLATFCAGSAGATAASASNVKVGAVSGVGAIAASSPPSGDLPVWSRDGKEIAFVAPTRWSYRVELMSGAGAGRRVVVNPPRTEGAAELRWAGSRHLIVSDSPGGDLRSIDVATGKMVELGSSPYGLGVGVLSLGDDDAFAASANGRRIAYTRDSPYENANMTSQGFRVDDFAIGVVSSLGGAGHMLPEPTDASDAFPSFSPNGGQVVFTRSYLTNGIASAPSLMLQSVKGGQARPLNVQGDRPVWSPNGRWIAYQQTTYVAEGLVPSKLEIVSPSGGSSHTIWSPNVHVGLGFSWSPDSTRIAFITESGQMGVATVTGKVTTFSLRGLAPDPGPSVNGFPGTPPEWSPDGKTLVFAVIVNRRHDETRIYAIGANGRGLHVVG